MKDKKCSQKSTIRISGELTCRAQVGWICPKCGKSLAPWVMECNCECPFIIRWVKDEPTTSDPRQPQETTSNQE